MIIAHNSKTYGLFQELLVKSVRDTFTAGGQIFIKGVKFPKNYKHLIGDLNKIYEAIGQIEEDDLMYYWKIKTIDCPIIMEWKRLCPQYCKKEPGQTPI